ncbi:murein DD-endopeptidase MepM/ murein hydrolase activator NlpD [Croceifilum oryzae]|uniref:Murein DD-endopeptidase MepM/ murein hydrolase activator NlpD n=1 Tax=Croceifilum oryzae TaxID=1553429 RepID=A0AAJ1TF81_9BACL|nr:M23 family metallopeptidase [Croceifilum oryzae]MDQ0415927.1 murein DD-endopeptidase MepM/ murein hydrolase activator NlpD [Croceifilum oryzae]
MRMWKRLFFAVLVLHVVAIPAVTAYAGSPTDTKRKVDDLNTKKQEEQSKLSDINGQITQIESEIAGYQKRMDELGKTYQATEQEFQKAREQETAAMKKVVTATRGLYEEGYLDSPLANLLQSDGVREFTEQFDLLKSVMGFMVEDFQHYKKAADRVTQKRKDLSKIQEDLGGEMKKIGLAKDQLREKQRASQVKVDGYDQELDHYEDEIININQDLLRSNKLNFPYTGPMSLPCNCTKVNSEFGVRVHPVTKKRSHHDGLDLDASYGAPVMAAADGVVVASNPSSGYGWLIVIYHGEKDGKSIYSAYAHSFSQQVITKLIGDPVKKGERISSVGNNGVGTGPHLHFEVRVGNVNKEGAVNPRLWLPPLQ